MGIMCWLVDSVVTCTGLDGEDIITRSVPPGEDACGTWLSKEVSEAIMEYGLYRFGRLCLTKAEGDVFWREERVRCRNFGCQKLFWERNPPKCRHHKAPPEREDTTVYWPCCPHKKAWDFDEFVRILGCTVGVCSP